VGLDQSSLRDEIDLITREPALKGRPKFMTTLRVAPSAKALV
jgi:hypothetical protein